MSDASSAVNTVSLGQSQSIAEPISPVSQDRTDKLSVIVDLLLQYDHGRKFKVGLQDQ